MHLVEATFLLASCKLSRVAIHAQHYSQPTSALTAPRVVFRLLLAVLLAVMMQFRLPPCSVLALVIEVISMQVLFCSAAAVRCEMITR